MLQQSYSSLVRRFSSLTKHFDDIRSQKIDSVDDFLRQWRVYEGILSVSWQAWCGFSRSVLFQSCLGTITRSGQIVLPVLIGETEGRIAYIARCLSKGDGIKPGRALLSHQEPTWGDRQIVLDCARHFRPGNLNSLELGLLLQTRSPEDMRSVRNATAHFTMENLSDIRALGAFYHGGLLRHPTDLLSWTENSTGGLAFHTWISDLIDCADYMTT